MRLGRSGAVGLCLAFACAITANGQQAGQQNSQRYGQQSEPATAQRYAPQSAPSPSQGESRGHLPQRNAGPGAPVVQAPLANAGSPPHGFPPLRPQHQGVVRRANHEHPLPTSLPRPAGGATPHPLLTSPSPQTRTQTPRMARMPAPANEPPPAATNQLPTTAPAEPSTRVDSNPLRQPPPADPASQQAGTQAAPTSPPENATPTAQPAPSTSDDGTPLLTPDKAKAVRESIAADPELDEATKKEFAEILNRIDGSLATANSFRDNAAKLKAEVDAAPQAILQLKEKLQTPIGDPKSPVDPQVQLADLESQANKLSETAKLSAETLDKLSKQIDGRSQSQKEIAKSREKVGKRVEQLENELKVASARESTPKATLLLLETRASLQAAKAQLAALDAERQHLEATAELQTLRRDQAKRQATFDKAAAAHLRAEVDKLRASESRRLAEEARRAAADSHPALRALAQENAKLAEARSKLAQQITAVAAKRKTVDETEKQLQTQFDDIQKRVELTSVSPGIGLLLRNQRSQLPPLPKFVEFADEAAVSMQRAQVGWLEAQQKREQVADIDQAVEAAISEVGQAEGLSDRELRELIAELITTRREILFQTKRDYAAYLFDLSELEVASNRCVDLIENYQSFIDEHILWTPSSDPISYSDLTESQAALAAIAQPNQWRDLVNGVVANTTGKPLFSGMLIAGCILLLIFRGAMQARLNRLGAAAGETLRLAPTIEALWWTLWLAAFAPAVLWCTGWWLENNGAGLADAVAYALETVAAGWLVVELFRQICRPNGLAEKHFHWPSTFNTALYSRLRWLILLTMPLLFAASFCRAFEEGRWNESLGRLVLLAGMVLMTIFLHLALRPNRGVLQVAFRDAVGGWFARMRRLWYVLGVGAPIGCAALLTQGYLYTVDQLTTRLLLTLGMLLLAVLGQAIAARALVVGWLRLAALRSSLAKRGDDASAANTATANPAAGDSAVETIYIDDAPSGEVEPGASGESAELHASVSADAPFEDSPAEDAGHSEQVCSQLRQFTRAAAVIGLAVGLWFIWVGVLPAVQALDFQLWQINATETFYVELPDGRSQPQQQTITKPFTVSSLLAVGLVLLATYVAA